MLEIFLKSKKTLELKKLKKFFCNVECTFFFLSNIFAFLVFFWTRKVFLTFKKAFFYTGFLHFSVDEFSLSILSKAPYLVCLKIIFSNN
jgi:hypothetical protein